MRSVLGPVDGTQCLITRPALAKNNDVGGAGRLTASYGGRQRRRQSGRRTRRARRRALGGGGLGDGGRRWALGGGGGRRACLGALDQGVCGRRGRWAQGIRVNGICGDLVRSSSSGRVVLGMGELGCWGALGGADARSYAGIGSGKGARRQRRVGRVRPAALR